MTDEIWGAVDRYITDVVVQPDAVLDEAVKAMAAAGLPEISVTPGQGKLLYLLAQRSKLAPNAGVTLVLRHSDSAVLDGQTVHGARTQTVLAANLRAH